jgi:YVTN family beta-propeller protein
LCYNGQDNKVYCANNTSDNVTVIDCATDSVLATVPVASYPWALCWNSQNDRVYCADCYSGYVSVIDGVTNSVVRAVEVGLGYGPQALAWNPFQNRVYVADNWSACISVLRDSMSGVEESPKPQAPSHKLLPTIVRGVLVLQGDKTQNTGHRAELLDATGRRVADLHSGANDVSRLSPGVYFVRGEGRGAGDAGPTRKVVIQR